MNLRREIVLDGAGKTIVIFRGADAPSHKAKYLVGRHRTHPELLVVVFDDSAEWHKQIASKFGIAPSGGGWLEADHVEKRIRLSGQSHAYGRELSRALSAAAFKALFPDYEVSLED